jgi:polyphosphate kinase
MVSDWIEPPEHFTPKEISWLAFNARLLQEADSADVPLLERLKFLGIYSANLDEFFRVRVATLKRLALLGRRSRDLIRYDPAKILRAVVEETHRQHAEYSSLYDRLIAELREHRIHLVNEKELDPAQLAFTRRYFCEHVCARLSPVLLRQRAPLVVLKDRSNYLAVHLHDSRERHRDRHALLELPTEDLPRYVVLPERDGDRYVIYLDDIVRANLDQVFAIFPHDERFAYMVKFSRDAELDLDDDIDESYLSRISRSLKKRAQAKTVRFLYDATIPKELLELLLEKLEIQRDDSLLPGGRYHNRSDLIGFPRFDSYALCDPPARVLSHPQLDSARRILSAIAAEDLLVHMPYHNFDRVLAFLREAALDPRVQSIQIALYRVARNSAVVQALINAVRNGKEVTVIMELQARFDEAANLLWTKRLQEAGAHVLVGVPGLKVHAKICLVTRKERGELRRYAVIGTGNYNEVTARVFSDIHLMTADPDITAEVERVFTLIVRPYRKAEFKHLMVSPYNLRQRVMELLDREIDFARKGEDAWVEIKLNNLSDDEIVARLYTAAQAGVRLRLNIRGMFSVQPGIPGVSEGIEAIGLVDRFLEHARVLAFGNGGHPEVWIGSADWLPRNFEKRIEVMAPVRNERLRRLLLDVLAVQWRDNRRARILDAGLNNHYRLNGGPPLRAQEATYDVLEATAEA